MLVVNRQKGQGVLLTLPNGKEITVHVLKGSKESSGVRLGIEAPANVMISRIDSKKREADAARG